VGIYEDVTAPTPVSALGVGASTDPLTIGGDPMQAVDTLEPMTPDLYQRIWAGTAPATSSTRVSGAALPPDRGPAMHGATSRPSGDAAQIIQFAKRFIGTPYVWGGTSYAGVDCSGLIKLAFESAGIKLPRVSADQVRTGRRVGFNQVQAGDLLGWDNSSRNNGADHVALVLGRKGNRVQIIEAARPGTNVRIRWVTAGEGAWGSRIL